MKNYILILIAVISLTNCSRPGPARKKAEKIKIDLEDTSKKYVEDVMDTIKTVTLKGGNNFSLTDIATCFVSDSDIVISDALQGAVFIFDSSGKLRKKIQPSHSLKDFKRGDFNTITDSYYDDKTKLIEIMDRTSGRIFRFDNHGNIKDTLNLNITRSLGYQFVKANNFYVSKLLNGNADRRSVGIYVKNGKGLKFDAQKLYTIPYLKYTNILLPHQLDVYRDSVYYFPILENKIYNLTTEQPTQEYELDYPGKYQMPSDLMNARPTKDIYAYYEKMEASGIIYENNSLFVTDDWITLRFDFKNKKYPRNIFYSKKSKKVLQYTALKSKTGMQLLSHAAVVAKYKDCFVMFAEAPIPKKNNDKVTKKGVYKLMYFKPKNLS
ncbi:6-bladed beta-propeller [Mucilaginibacter sp. UR6-11]|uniref:6-bladed beta-propeller n=1 Tax=Mucilaginibacter sp. UR6-11 TaxID=1435644 RepID=UPI001E283FF9|nr:6-bladed beta-propeller [Mucilaginibacter sp. UR6-11]MCC8423846.1 6-bladed beta-propeller [Mucilaginibacter sp. UR6-11]